MTTQLEDAVPQEPVELTLHRRVATNVRAQMAARQVTQVQMATFFGVSQPAVSLKVRGVTPFTVNELGALARWWGIDPSELLAAHPWHSPNSGQAVNSGWRSRLHLASSRHTTFVTPVPTLRVA